MDTSEHNFEDHIVKVLVEQHGYQQRFSASQSGQGDYRHDLCLIPRDVLDFVRATQPDAWDKLRKVYGDNTEEKFLWRLSQEVDKHGTLDVMRKGFKDAGARFKLVYFPPSTALNEDYQRQYEANVFSVVQQVFYKEGRKFALDLGIFINGLPIFTVELKNPLSGQKVQNAIYQYRHDRDPKEPLFKFGRCLAHFAVDSDLVYMTSHLRGKKTRFLPFNKGKYGGAGNPPVIKGYATGYLWESIWAKDSVLNLLEQFIQIVDIENDKGEKTGKQALVFPRYHQLDAVRRLVNDARDNGSGKRYLIQHSAGSGKSYSIGWLAHQLSSLHGADDKRVFDSVIVITDRRILDRQLQNTIRQLEQTRGVVETIGEGKTSKDLREALESGKQIIVSTLQKFPMIVTEVAGLPGTGFAVIVDEAHSSQSGESVKSLKQVLSVNTLDEAAAEEENDDPHTWEDYMTESAEDRKFPPNISVFAFTATPKNKTLELFGTPQPDGTYAPFSLYSMRQAIDEGFILDVLKNYTTYRAYWKLLKKVEDDPEYESKKAKLLLKRFMDLHRDNITKKVEIIVEHFHESVAHHIGGKAKAMIVTRSRLHAVRYAIALKAYLKENNYPYHAMVAFSGTVQDGGIDFTEANMNGFPDKETAEQFKRDDYRFLVVANKFQTGFDQPLLSAMYVDKLLSGVHAVQTLSRLNRMYESKEETMVLDFANEVEHVRLSFQPYYETTILSESTDHNLLYDRERELEEFHFYTEDDVQNFARILFTPGSTQDQLHQPLDVVVDRFDLASEDEQADFRGKLMDYIRLYAFLSQIIPFEDPDLEALYAFAKLLRRKLPLNRTELPTEIVNDIDIASYRVRQTHEGDIQLEREGDALDPMAAGGVFGASDENYELLSQILETLNEVFGEDGEKHLETLIGVKDIVVENESVNQSISINSRDKARLTVDDVAMSTITEMYKTNFDFYHRVNGDDFVKSFVLDWIFDQVMTAHGNAGR